MVKAKLMAQIIVLDLWLCDKQCDQKKIAKCL